MYVNIIPADPWQVSESPYFELVTLPPGPELADVVWNVTVKIRDRFWATTTVLLQPTIGRIFI